MKRWIRLGTIVAVIAAMVIALVVLRNRPDEPIATDQSAVEPPPASERVTLLSGPRDEIARVTVRTEGNELTIARMDTGVFRPVYGYDVEFVENRVNRIVQGAASMSSRRTIGEVDDLSEYGLDEPGATITVATDDGSEQRIVVGDRTPARDAYYVMRPDDPNVYTVFNSWIAPFLTTLDQLRVRAIPQITFEELERIVIDTLSGRTIRATKVPEWDDDPELGFAVFAVTEPFSRRFQANQNWFEQLNTQLGSLSIGRFVDDAPASLAAYGLEPPQARVVVADANNTLDLLVGSPTEGGRFAKFAGTPSVFVLSGVEPIVSVRPYSTVSAFALIVNIELVDSFTVEGPDTVYRGRIERTPVEGEEEPEETYYLNDEVVEEDLFKDLYQWAIGLQFDAEIEQRSTGLAEGREPIATITYNLNTIAEPLSVSFVPENANFAAVVRDGQAEFLIARAKIERMLDAYEEARSQL